MRTLPGTDSTSPKSELFSSAELPPSDEPYNPVRGEMALWQAVITQALMDASSNSTKHEARYHRHSATSWLMGRSKDFVTVCLNAGWEPEDVRTKARAALMRGCKWRAEPVVAATAVAPPQPRRALQLFCYSVSLSASHGSVGSTALHEPQR